MKAGDRSARDALFAGAYEELKILARARLRSTGPGAGLDTIMLVSESYLRFVRAGALRAERRRSFFAYVSRVMRSVIIESVRGQRAQRRGGDAPHVELSTELAGSLAADDSTVRRVHEALEALEKADARAGTVAQLRFLSGHSIREIAARLGINDRTVARDLRKARMILAAELAP